MADIVETTPTPIREQEPDAPSPDALAEVGGQDPPKRRRWPWVAAGLVVLAGAIVGVAASADRSDSDNDTNRTAFNTAEVAIADLEEFTTLAGTLGREAGDPIVAPRGGTLTFLPDKGAVISQGEVLYEINDEPVMLLYGSTPSYRDLTLNDEIDMVGAAVGTITWLPESGSTIEEGEVLFELDGRPIVLLYGSTPAYRDIALGEVDINVATLVAGTVTSLPHEGEEIAEGDVLFEINGEPVVLMYGDEPATRVMEDLDTNLIGEDIRQLEEALVNLGFADADELEVDGEFTSSTADAVVLWQEAIGAEPDGVVDLGDVVFLPGPIEIDELEADDDDEADEGDILLLALGAGSILGDDVRQLEEALVGLGYASEDDIEVDREFDTDTAAAVVLWQEAIGAEADGVVDLGEVVFLPGPIEVLELVARVGDLNGSAPLWIGTGAQGMAGSDVAQLEEALVALGYDADGTMVADGIMSPETVTAIVAWQAATGQEVDGFVQVGDVVFADTSVRVSGWLVALGASATPGAPILQITGNEVVVAVELAAEDQGIIDIGQVVTVELPDSTRTSGTVSDVATVATTTADGRTIFEVTVTLDDPDAAGTLDEAPVDVDLVTDSVSNVVVVPVTALLVLREGGYAVEIDNADGTTTLVGVDPGFFADGLVELRVSNLEPGTRVVVP